MTKPYSEDISAEALPLYSEVVSTSVCMENHPAVETGRSLHLECMVSIVLLMFL